MSIINCLKGKVSKTILKDLVAEREAIKKAGANDIEADAKLLANVTERINSAKKAKIMLALKYEEVMKQVKTELAFEQGVYEGLTAAARLVQRLLGREPSMERTIASLYQRAEYSGQNAAYSALSMMTEVYEVAATKGFAYNKNPEAMKGIVRVLLDGGNEATDPNIASIAGKVRKVLNSVIEQHRAEGGMIGHLEKYFPISHNATKIGAVDEATWVKAYTDMNDITQITDFKTGVPMTAERFEEIAHDTYKRIVFGGSNQAAKEIEGGGLFKSTTAGKVDIFARRMQSRFSRPKDSDAFLKYNELFGSGDEGLYSMLVNSVRDIAHDIGVMRELSPMPAAMHEGLMKTARAQSTVKNRVKTEQRLNGLFNTLTSNWLGTADGFLASAVPSTQRLLTSSLLGMAAVAGLSDQVFIRSVARMGKMSGGAQLDGFFKGLVGKPDDIVAAYHITEAMQHNTVSRFAGETVPFAGAFTQKAASLNSRASGLQNVTLASGSQMILVHAANLAKLAKTKTAFKDIPEGLRRFFIQTGIGEKHWDEIAAIGSDERGFITRQTMLDAGREDLARLVGMTEIAMRQWGTNAPDLYVRSLSSGMAFGNRVKNSGVHLAASSVMQFKSFPVQVWRQHFAPALIRAANGNVAPIGMLFLQSAFAGMLIVNLKEMMKGREPTKVEDMDGAFLARALVQSGFGGILGDMFLKDPDAYGRDIVKELVGAVPSVAGEVALESYSAVLSAGDEKQTSKAKLIDAYKRLVPLSTLWYGTAAFDRIVMDTLHAASEDNFYGKAAKYNKDHPPLFPETGKGAFTKAQGF